MGTGRIFMIIRPKKQNNGYILIFLVWSSGISEEFCWEFVLNQKQILTNGLYFV